MALYFETEMQGIGFLLLCAVGFLVTLLFDCVGTLFPQKLKPLSDILLLLIGGVVFLLALVFLRANALRVFHWIALLTGSILYLCGVRYAWMGIAKKVLKKNHKKKDSQAGEKHPVSK